MLIAYLAMIANDVLLGHIVDGLVSKGWTVTHVEKLAQAIVPHLKLQSHGSVYLFGVCLYRFSMNYICRLLKSGSAL